jgi:hypothetical protein
MDLAPEDTEPADFSLILQWSGNWDTLGWVKFRAGDFPGGENYLQTAWDMVQSAVSDEHLVEAHEKTGKKEKHRRHLIYFSPETFEGRLRHKESRIRPWENRVKTLT